MAEPGPRLDDVRRRANQRAAGVRRCGGDLLRRLCESERGAAAGTGQALRARDACPRHGRRAPIVRARAGVSGMKNPKGYRRS